MNADQLKGNSAADGMKIKLSSDIGYDEEMVAYMLADISLGGPVEFYEEIFNSWNDPNAGESVRRHKNNARIRNLDQFERIDLPGKGIKIVWKGTKKIINGSEIKMEN